MRGIDGELQTYRYFLSDDTVLSLCPCYKNQFPKPEPPPMPWVCTFCEASNASNGDKPIS